MSQELDALRARVEDPALRSDLQRQTYPLTVPIDELVVVAEFGEPECGARVQLGIRTRPLGVDRAHRKLREVRARGRN